MGQVVLMEVVMQLSCISMCELLNMFQSHLYLNVCMLLPGVSCTVLWFHVLPLLLKSHQGWQVP